MPKRKWESLEDLLEKVFCYYCEKICSDLKALQDHQKVKHLQCDICWKKMDSLGGLKVHHESVHKLPLTTIANALPERSSPDGPEIYLMEGVPQEMKDSFKAGIIREYEKREYEHRIKTGNPLPGSAAALNQAKKIKVEEEDPEERRAREKARRDAHLAKRRAELKAAKEAKQNGGVTVKTEPSDDFAAQQPYVKMEQHDPSIKPEPSSEAFPGSQYFEQQYNPGYSVSPPMGGLPVSQPSQQSYGFGAGPHFGYSPTSYVQPTFQNTAFQQPYGPGYAGSPQGYAPQPVINRSPSAHQLPTIKAESSAGNGNSLTPAAVAGLPQRPSFNAPSYSKEVMQKFHDGQTVPKLKPAAGPTTDAAASGKASTDQRAIDQASAIREAEPMLDTSNLDSNSGEATGPTSANIVRQLDDLLAGGDENKEITAAEINATQADVVPTPSTQAATGSAKQGKGDATRGTVHMVRDNYNSPEEKKGKQAKYAQLTSKKRRKKGRNDTVVEQADSQAVTGSVADNLEQ